MSGKHTLRTNRFCTLVIFQKNPSLSIYESTQYLLNVHSNLVVKFMEGRDFGLVKYEQLHVNQDAKAALKTMGIQVLEDYDGAVLFEIESFDKFSALWTSPEYIADIAPDERKFALRETALFCRFSIATIFNREEAAVIHAGYPGQSLTYCIRKDRVRMLFLFKHREGVTTEELERYFLELCDKGEEIIKCNLLYPAAPDAVSRIDNSSSKLVPDWDGAVLVDALSFNILYEFIAGWGGKGTLHVVPVNVASIIGPAAWRE
ncbi:conidial pigment polyketide synthase alb1 [Moniliophthora roreri]|uniref:EthD domain-containing protein n=1 Tax=Moniliophthora roreri TaxID=221103 RepID=A0A0W0G8Q5_MONRR|nr:conidial pigment polyketide synthase alb1 [Moniliophthora roreri]